MSKSPSDPSRVVKLTPYRQGQLDALCGMYAVVNALRWSLGNHPLAQKGIFWERLFQELMKSLSNERAGQLLLSEGLSIYATLRMAKLAVRNLELHHECKLTLRRPFARAKTTHPTDVLNVLSSHLQNENCCAIVAVYGALNHWCVVKRVTSEYVDLFDSDGVGRLGVNVFKPKNFVARQCGKSHVSPGSVILITYRPSACFDVIDYGI